VTRLQREVLNPGGGAVMVDNAAALIAEYRANGFEPYIDLGGGMEVPLAEVTDYDEPGGED
jgi:predicted ATP-dependent endonuclease of OLD family